MQGQGIACECVLLMFVDSLLFLSDSGHFVKRESRCGDSRGDVGDGLRGFGASGRNNDL